MLWTRRRAIASCGSALALLQGSAVGAETYPGRTIKLIVPYPAGGTTDLLGRMIADQLQTGLGGSVIVENKPGAGTTVGAEQVARARPDGYTLLLATSTTLAINKTLYRNLPYDPVKDFTEIALVAGVPFALIVNPRSRPRRCRSSSPTPKPIRGWPTDRPAMAARNISAPRC